MNGNKIDLSLFIIIIPESNRSNRLEICANPSGYVSVSANLRGQIQWEKIVFLINAAADRVLIKEHTTEESYFTIPNASPIGAKAFTRALAGKNVSLPAIYTMTWDEELQMWIGVLTHESFKELVPSKKPVPPKKFPKKKMPSIHDIV